jgi:hypothetical protein
MSLTRDHTCTEPGKRLENPQSNFYYRRVRGRFQARGGQIQPGGTTLRTPCCAAGYLPSAAFIDLSSSAESK